MTNTPVNLVPVIPENAPFTPEQRAWLNGFLAGLFSRAPLAAANLGGALSPAAPLQPLTILFGSQTGNAEVLAKKAAQAAGQRGFAPTVCDMAHYARPSLAREENLLIITSTYGDGEPPDNAKAFWEYLADPQAPALERTRFSVCALGDTNYEKFCQCGREMDRRLGELKAQRVFPRADCDADFAGAFGRWLDGTLAALGAGQAVVAATHTPSEPLLATAPGYSRARPFPAVLTANRVLNGPGSAKETRHFEMALDDSGLTYQAGDALGVAPSNAAGLVGELLGLLGADGEAPVTGANGATVSLREALTSHYEITRIPKALLAFFAARSGDPTLQRVTAPEANGELEKYLWGRDLVDLLAAFPNVKPAPLELIGCLRKLSPRYYSISSSPKAHPGRVHLTVGMVRYEAWNRARQGVCSSFLSGQERPGARVPVFIQPNPNFRPPADGSRPVVMVGPGTGVAPFRAFIQERRATGAQGKNWLFFGDQRAATDFLYREELEAMMTEGTLNRLDTAFSRDQAEKIYVQNRMLDHARELFAWLEQGAHFYVCGDANRMAKDVDQALVKVVEAGGGRNAEQAAEYVQQLKAEKRYQRDVY